METKIFENTKEDLCQAAKLINSGETVIFPTETVYGLGADAFNPDAVKKIFEAKGRPSDNPLIVHIADFNEVQTLAAEIPDNAKILAERFWPGPLTMILKKKPCVPDVVSAGLDTVGIRIPEDKTAREFLKACKTPIAAPSANVSGRPSPTTFSHVVEDMTGRVSGIIKGEDSFVGVESTVIDLTSKIPTVLRPGGISLEELKEVLGEVLISSELAKDNIPKAPGMKYKHYSPKGQTYILRGSVDEVSKFLDKRSKLSSVAVLVFDEFKNDMPLSVKALSLGSKDSPTDAARRLFACLRACDDLGAKEIYAPEIPDNGLWRAVKNRLYKAASARIIDVKNAKSILFVCTGNTCRSPMAEGIFNTLNKNAIAISAGLMAGGGATEPNAVLAAAEFGADIKNHTSQTVTEKMIENSDIVLTMTAAHKLSLPDLPNVMTISEFAGEVGDISDPYGCGIETYKSCAKKIKALLEKMKI